MMQSCTFSAMYIIIYIRVSFSGGRGGGGGGGGHLPPLENCLPPLEIR